jgi:hypothetical protein
MVRLVPEPPRLTFINRGMARLPLGGPTGVACAAAGFACAIGLLVIAPSVGLRSPFRDEAIAPQAPLNDVIPDRARARTATERGKPAIEIVVAAFNPSTGHAAAETTPAARDPERAPSTPRSPTTRPSAYFAPGRTSRLNGSAEPRADRRTFDGERRVVVRRTSTWGDDRADDGRLRTSAEGSADGTRRRTSSDDDRSDDGRRRTTGDEDDRPFSG